MSTNKVKKAKVHGLVGKLPEGGSPGQFIGKTENGDEWVDPIQSDLFQSDPTAPDYVKNKGYEAVTYKWPDFMNVLVDKTLFVVEGELKQVYESDLDMDTYNAWWYILAGLGGATYPSVLKDRIKGMVNLHSLGIISDNFSIRGVSNGIPTDEIALVWSYQANNDNPVCTLSLAGGSNMTIAYYPKTDTFNKYVHGCNFPVKKFFSSIDDTKGYISQVAIDKDPAEPMQIATKQYVDNNVATGEETIEALIEVDALPAVKQADGAILSVGNDILLW